MMGKATIWAALVAGTLTAGSAAAQSTQSVPGAQRAPETTQLTASASSDEIHRPFAFSLTPGLSTNGFEAHRVVNNVSLGFIGVHARRLEGFATALIGTWFDRNVGGLQVSLVHNQAGGTLTGMQAAVGLNTVGGDATGHQSAVIGNTVKGDLLGVQAAVGFNSVGRSVRGAQFAVGLNVAGASVEGLQAAAGLNLAPQDLTGAQLGAGVGIIRNRLDGLQATAGMSYAGHVHGAQLSVLNVGGEIEGAQIGVINIASKVRGAQIGIVNVAGESTASVGVLSFVPEGLHLQAYATDATVANVALRMGGRSLHTLLVVGYHPANADDRYLSLGVGIGAHLPITARLYADVDLISHRLHKRFWTSEDQNIHGQLRAVAGLQLASHFSVFAGVTANTFIDWDDGVAFRLSEGYGWKHDAGPVNLRVWPGVVAGIQL